MVQIQIDLKCETYKKKGTRVRECYVKEKNILSDRVKDCGLYTRKLYSLMISLDITLTIL